MNCKTIISYIAAAAFAVAALFSLSACRDDNAEETNKGVNGWFNAVMQGSPDSLDPQTCTGNNASQIIANVFRGLYSRTDSGKIVPAMAKACTASEDRLVWTFELCDDVRWYGKDGFSAECTADDFVFAFQRLVDPALCSEHAKEYYCIKNAKEINKGKIPDVNELGVKATGKYSLEITLTEPRTDLEELLAAPPAMPCNREFYELSEGQYGLVQDYIGSNGYFYVSRWHYDKWMEDGNFIELRRNEENADALGTAPRGVTFAINTNGYEGFLAGTVDVYGTAVPDEIFRLSGKYEHSGYSDAVWGLVFNTDGAFESADLRIALGGCAVGTFDSAIYTGADYIVPENAVVGDTAYRASAGYPEKASYSEAELLERGERAMRELGAGALSGMKLLIPEGTALKQGIGAVIQRWQKNFGVYCMISELPYQDYISALENGSFDAAAVRLGGSVSAVSGIAQFASSSAHNYGNVNSRKLDDIIGSMLTAQNDGSAARYCLEGEQLILDSAWFVPLCFENEHIFYANGVSGVGYIPSEQMFIFGYALQK